jgi:hypothetical protein
MAKNDDAGTYRYNLSLPKPLFDDLKKACDKNGMTVVEALRKFIKIGLLILEVQDKPETTIIIREGTTERELLIF